MKFSDTSVLALQKAFEVNMDESELVEYLDHLLSISISTLVATIGEEATLKRIEEIKNGDPELIIKPTKNGFT